MKTLQDRIKHARDAADLTQEQLAAASGVSQSTIARLESGRNSSTRLAAPLARALNVSSDWLLGGVGEFSGPGCATPPAVVGGVNVALLIRNLEETSQNEGSDELACRCADALTVLKGLLGHNTEVPALDSANFSAQLLVTREATDAEARAGAVRALSASSIPAGAGTPPTTAVESPVVHAREIYAGVMAAPTGARYHLILLSGDARTNGAEVAQEFAASLGGELPTYAELKVLQKRTHGQFRACLYYTCEQEPHDGDMATMLFDATPAGEQRKDVNELRARAVRRVPVLAAIQEG